MPQYRTCGDGAVIRRLVLDKQHAGTRSLVNVESQRLAVLIHICTLVRVVVLCRPVKAARAIG